ncbi:TetR/AcrR family transcriptional regulator [Compostimonas suwonensis]|uniref:AcrR family transcriptional regulator n=1 Tax=Compostimonas suwonensis TaxID=1048394 RepID=A0A2M9BTS6_9MICO|nr:TetR/AcrR family transcriptional regulator [Compostimonas suwonensis]PJJ61359.1 AcrR family transcriptional regulator [Compostimonas suwonensis]
MVEFPNSSIRPMSAAALKIRATAAVLFYDEGIHTVGVDRIIADAGVTKATFYKHFPSKDSLVVAYVYDRDAAIREHLGELARTLATPELVVRALAATISDYIQAANFRGCPFINAAAQVRDETHPARLAVTEHREWYSAFVEGLFRDLGHPRPGDAADDFFVVRDGAMSGVHVGDTVASNAALRRGVDRLIRESHATQAA